MSSILTQSWHFVRDYPSGPVPERYNESGFYWSKSVSGSEKRCLHLATNRRPDALSATQPASKHWKHCPSLHQWVNQRQTNQGLHVLKYEVVRWLGPRRQHNVIDLLCHILQSTKIELCNSPSVHCMSTYILLTSYQRQGGSMVGHNHKVTLRRARSVLGRVTIFGGHRTSVTKPPRSSQPPTLSGKGNE